jgi:hypothetical protein
MHQQVPARWEVKMGRGGQLAKDFIDQHKPDELEKKGANPEAKTTADLVRQLRDMKPDERQEFAKALENAAPGKFLTKDGPPRSPTDIHPPVESIIYNGKEIPLQPKLESRSKPQESQPSGKGIGDMTPEEINRQYGRGTGVRPGDN